MKDEGRTVLELIRIVFEVTESVEVWVKVSVLVDWAEEVNEVTETGVEVHGRSTVTVLVHPQLRGLPAYRELPPCLKFGI
jgi:hypothetical protein